MKDETHEAADAATGSAPGQAPAEAPVTDPAAAAEAVPDIESRLREAEQRGYLRGRNEVIERLMAAPAMWQPTAPAPPVPEEPVPTILQNIRPCVWD